MMKGGKEKSRKEEEEEERWKWLVRVRIGRLLVCTVRVGRGKPASSL